MKIRIVFPFDITQTGSHEVAVTVNNGPSMFSQAWQDQVTALLGDERGKRFLAKANLRIIRKLVKTSHVVIVEV